MLTEKIENFILFGYIIFVASMIIYSLELKAIIVNAIICLVILAFSDRKPEEISKLLFGLSFVSIFILFISVVFKW